MIVGISSFLALILLSTHTTSAIEWNTGIVCSSEFDRCYQYVLNPLNFTLAEGKCMELGGHLLSVRNADENSFINYISSLMEAQSFQKRYWIGANNLTGVWEWTDGSPFNFTRMLPFPGCSCKDYNDSIYWYGESCDNILPFVCGIPHPSTPTCPTTYIPQTCPTVPPVYIICDIGWTYLPTTESCYKVYHNANYSVAEASCLDAGAHLTSIHSEAENTFINDLASTGIRVDSLNNLAYIGLHQVGESWVWTDGSKTDYLNWAPKQPDRPGRELCVQTASDFSFENWDKDWNNVECSASMRAFVCKKPSNRS